MISTMEPEPPKDDQSQYDIFRQESSLETIEVAEERSASSGQSDGPKLKRRRSLRRTLKRAAVPLGVVLLLASVGTGIALFNRQDKQGPTVVINTQSLDNGTLNELTSKNGDPAKQQLTITPDTIFKNNVSVQGSTDIIKNLSVSGTAKIQGATDIRDTLSIGKSLSVGTNLTVNGLITAASLNVGSLTISSINLSSNLVFGGHIVPSGSVPTARASSAAGGGSVSITGNDTAGTITITTGGGPIAGELAIITFHTAFGTTPKVQLTPLNSSASGLNYFVTHTAGLFTVNTSTVPSANATYIFDYLVTQ
jgi:hypothetical protein